MTELSQSDFAKLKGWNRSTVTRLKQAGRLVMVCGLVDVEATEARLAETVGGRDDVAARHAAGRGDGEKVSRGGTPPPRSAGSESRADAQARKESKAADILEVQYEQMMGLLVKKEAVDVSHRDVGASIRARVERVADQLAPLTTPITDFDENHAIISEAMRGLLHEIEDDLVRAERAYLENE